ncbi:MAG: transporter substrate-binding domain-containing protein [Ruminococcaceae bacterium]|nr:transporter substrate-binding domain-containing protein [Oscillospiraceae bacterium]
MKKILSIVLAAMMLMACVSCGGAKVADVDAVKAAGKMIIGITEYAPMNYKDENGEWTGFDTEFAELVCEKLGVAAEFIVIDWDNKILELDSKGIDAVWNGMTITDEVKNGMSVSNAYVKNAQVVVMAADAVANYADAASMADLAFAVEAGSAGEAAAADAGLTNVTAVVDQATALMEVASGSVDACVIDITMANAMTGEGTSYTDLGYAVELTTEEYGIGFRKGSDLAEEVNKIMADLIADGTLPALAEKYSLTLAN